MLSDSILDICRYGLAALSVIILFRCLRSMLSRRLEPEIWAYIRVGRSSVPVFHWENIIGSSRSADIRVYGSGIGRVHAILKRSDAGIWYIYDVFSKGGVWVDGEKVKKSGMPLCDGSTINLGGSCVRFAEITTKKRMQLEDQRSGAGRLINPVITLIELSIFEALLALGHTQTASDSTVVQIVLAFALLLIIQWLLYLMTRSMHRNGFEPETLAFYLTAIGISVSAGSVPDDILRHMILVAASVALFVLFGLWLRNLTRVEAFRYIFGILSLGLLAVNVVSGTTAYGAANWLTVGGFSFQPSELVKVGYIYVGAASIDRLYRRRNLFTFIVFSAVIVGALALIGDFGTAVIFFVTFLIISFMRSGSIATALLAITGAGMAGLLAVSVKPYIAQRFAIWGHVWEDVYDKGYQQTRAMSAVASGGLWGKGPGGGWLKDIFASNTDMVFAYVSEELGLIVAVSMVLALLLLAFFAVKSASTGRSSYMAIASCAAMGMLLVQLALNVFGSLDILPFTGVTFPFVSQGGSSLISCWLLLAYLKAADNRRGASFCVRPLTVAPDNADYGQEGAVA